MRFLLDTHLLLWAAYEPDRLSPMAREALTDQDNELMFSAASLWEVAIKASLGRADFQVDLPLFHSALLDMGCMELPVVAEHALVVAKLPRLHKDPFDRLLVAQATQIGVTLLTVDRRIAHYPGPVRLV